MSTELEQRNDESADAGRTEGAIPETEQGAEAQSSNAPPETPKTEEAPTMESPQAQGVRSVTGPEEETPPVPTLPDLRIVLEDDTGVFDPDAEPRMLTRVAVVRGLIEKHAIFMEKYKIELETGVSVDPVVLSTMEAEKNKRDELNTEVGSLKDHRTALKEENRNLRRRFLEMLRIQEQLKEKSKEISEINEFIDRQEYKLMTEGVNLESERKLMKDIKESINNIRQLTGGYVPKEVEDELETLDGKINSNFTIIEESHQKMLSLVQESQIHHQKFVDEAKKVREAEARKGWLQRRITLHHEMLKFWETQIQNAETMDASDVGRTAAQIKDRLLREIEEAAKAEEQARRPRREEGPKATEEAAPAETSPGSPEAQAEPAPAEPAPAEPAPVEQANPPIETEPGKGGSA